MKRKTWVQPEWMASYVPLLKNTAFTLQHDEFDSAWRDFRAALARRSGEGT